jgi:hypothetical protein
MRLVWPLLLGLALPALALESVPGYFSRMSIGDDFSDGWQLLTLRDTKPTQFSLVEDAGVSVVRAHANASGGSLLRAIRWDTAAHPRLQWRWRVDRVVAQGDIRSKGGDDFTARLYVMFDYPDDRLSFADRAKLTIARWIYGEEVPAAALCYVWDNHAAVGTRVWNAYTDRVRMIVLRNATSGVGDWADEQRDLVADYREAFGEAPSPVSGIAIAADTDQTGETVTAWFGDIRISE